MEIEINCPLVPWHSVHQPLVHMLTDIPRLSKNLLPSPRSSVFRGNSGWGGDGGCRPTRRRSALPLLRCKAKQGTPVIGFPVLKHPVQANWVSESWLLALNFVFLTDEDQRNGCRNDDNDSASEKT